MFSPEDTRTQSWIFGPKDKPTEARVVLQRVISIPNPRSAVRILRRQCHLIMMAQQAARPMATTVSAADATHRPTSAATPAGVTLNSPNTAPNRVPDTYARMTASFCSFLAVSMHQILYLRNVYPPSTFLPVRQYNHPVKQSRHPRVCSWINDACTSVEAELLKCTLTGVSFIIVSARTNRPLERYTFDMSQMPRVAPSDIHTPFATSVSSNDDLGKSQESTSTVDMEAQFRAVLARLASACARLTPLPQHEEYRFSLFITVRADADAPAGLTREEQMWIPAEPDSLATVPIEDVNSDFPERNSFGTNGSAKGPDVRNELYSTSPKPSNKYINNSKPAASHLRAQTVPVRRVDAGAMKLEVWVEEAFGKFDILDRLHAESPP